MKGKLIVIEGIDGSGKTTQYNLLLEALRASGCDIACASFPNYESLSGKLVSAYLQGAFGAHPGDVNAFAASSFFAVDRFASFRSEAWGDCYRRGGTVLAARYTTSNAVHQASKLPAAEREPFFAWLAHYEYELLGLPKPDKVFWLDLPVEVALERIASRSVQTGAVTDIHEKDAAYLRASAEAAAQAAAYYGWTRIPVMDRGNRRTVEDIHKELMAAVKF